MADEKIIHLLEEIRDIQKQNGEYYKGIVKISSQRYEETHEVAGKRWRQQQKLISFRV